jgi:uncharacterized protein YndB with AHSA1/START domain
VIEACVHISFYDMSQVVLEHTISAPLSKVWDALADFGGIHKFHPGVDRSPIINDKGTGCGAKRTCHFYQGMAITEEIIEFKPGESLTIAVPEPPMPVEDMRTIFAVQQLGPTQTKVIVEMSYRPKLGPVGALMNAVVLRGRIRSLVGKVLEGLQRHLETGAYIGKNGVAA